MGGGGTAREYYRRDGVRIQHDPYAPGVAARYGREGETDPEGFDPYRDSVGPGIYGGRVQRDAAGADVGALDSYGYTPLFRMASNNLAEGAEALLRAGADPGFRSARGETATSIARASSATGVLAVLQR